MKRIPIRLKLLLTTSLLVLGVVGGVLAILSSIVSKQVRATTEEASKQSNIALELAVSGSQQQLLTLTTLLANRPGTQNVYQTDSATISDHLNELVKTVNTDWMVLTDETGAILGQSSHSPYLKKGSLSTFTAIQAARKRLTWRGVLNTPETIAISASQPIVVGDYLKAVLITGRQIDQGFLRPIARATNSEIAIFRDTTLVASSRPFKHLNLRSRGLQHFAQGIVTYVATPDRLPGVPEGAPLQFAALIPEYRITEPFEPLWNGLTLILVAGLIISVVAGTSLAHSFAEPIGGLVKAAQILRSGYWPEPFGATRQDELGILQGAFDEMTIALRKSRDRLEGLLDIDPLTELLNYRRFRSHVDAAVSDWQEGGRAVGLLVMDIDHFEAYNQSHGTEGGDEVLKQLADILKSETLEGEYVARYAGNEFALLIEGTDPMSRAKGIRDRIEAQTPVTVSIGLCTISDETARTELFLLAAESSASQAKSAGRNRVREFESFQFSTDDADLKQFLQHGSYGAVRALAEAVDAKDEYTRGHSQRVANYARNLAEFCGKDQGFVELVYVAGTLHDVGKIGVPDAVLKKQERLDDAEFAQIKLHPELGEKIVRQIPQLKDTLPGIRHHHEQFDGKGYPDGLAGEEISLLARILAVADTFDAMTSDRPYRKGLPHEVALAEIERGAGTQFDPVLAHKFIELMRDSTENPLAA